MNYECCKQFRPSAEQYYVNSPVVKLQSSTLQCALLTSLYVLSILIKEMYPEDEWALF